MAKETAAIDYASLASLGPGTKPLHIGGVEPNPTTISTGGYRLVRPFLPVTKKDPGEEVQAFVEFCLSLAGQVSARVPRTRDRWAYTSLGLST